jgi:hypothetical protein
MDTQHRPLAYCYDPKSGRYAGIEEADPDPKEPGNWLLPANATFEAPHFGDPLPRHWYYFWTGEGWVAKRDEQAAAAQEAAARRERNRLLRESDWTQLSDAPMSTGEYIAWATYRQALRDLPSNPEWPFVQFPAPPGKEVTKA